MSIRAANDAPCTGYFKTHAMLSTSIRAIALLALPAAIFLAGVWIMNEVSDRQQVFTALSAAHESDRTPLNQRFGYDVAAVDRHWSAILARPEALEAERLFLELDLIFPIFYGAALASSLLLAWAYLGRRFNPGWVIAPVAVMVIADWIENLVQLSRLRHYAHDGIAALSGPWIQVASAATIVKLTFSGIIALILFTLVVTMFYQTLDNA